MNLKVQKPRTSFLPNVQQQYYKKDLVFNARMGKERLFDVNFTPTFGFKTFSVTSVVKFWGHESIWSRFLQTFDHHFGKQSVSKIKVIKKCQ